MSDLWVGLALSIPVGIGVNLASGPTQRWLGKRSQQAADRESARSAMFVAQATAFAKDRSELYTYLLEAVLMTTYIGALIGVLSGSLAFLGQGVDTAVETLPMYWYFSPDFARSLLFLLSQFTALLGSIIILNIARRALRTLKKVRELRSDQ